jgi:hypothetical protein
LSVFHASRERRICIYLEKDEPGRKKVMKMGKKRQSKDPP